MSTVIESCAKQTETYRIFGFPFATMRKSSRFPYLLAVSTESNNVLTKTFDMEYISIDVFSPFSKEQNVAIRDLNTLLSTLYQDIHQNKFDITGINFTHHYKNLKHPTMRGLKEQLDNSRFAPFSRIELGTHNVGYYLKTAVLPSDLSELKPKALERYLKFARLLSSAA